MCSCKRICGRYSAAHEQAHQPEGHAVKHRLLALARHHLPLRLFPPLPPQFAIKRPDAAVASRELRKNVLYFVALVATVRALPYVLEAFKKAD